MVSDKYMYLYIVEEIINFFVFFRLRKLIDKNRETKTIYRNSLWWGRRLELGCPVRSEIQDFDFAFLHTYKAVLFPSPPKG